MKIRKVIGIVGKAGSGKSTLSNKISNQFQRVFLIDSDEDFTGHVCYNFKQVKQYFDYVGYSKDISFRIVCRFEDIEEINKIFVFAWYMEKCLIVADEFSYYIEHDTDEFNKVMFQGRHREISMIVIGQRFVQFPASLRSTFTTLISFQQTETLDLNRAMEYGFNPDLLANLEQYKYLTIGENIT